MLNKIYKYTPLRLEFFDNFLLRASQKYALNDPFELRPSFKIKGSNLSKLDFETLSENSYFDYAVISLSETNNNLLMWSHYADQHKGIVIEFDTDNPIFESYKSPILTKFDEELDEEVLDENDAKLKSEINAGAVQRVRYNSLRPNIKGFDSVLEHFLVKSEEWIYEKEHRIILPLVTADRIIVHKRYLSSIEDNMYSPEVLQRKFIANNMYMINVKEPLLAEMSSSFPYDEEYVSAEEMQLSMADAIIHEFLQEISEDPSTVFLYKVPVHSIKSIYLGCRVSESDKDEIIEKIESNPKLSHVQIYQAHTSSERFELEFEKLTKRSN
ncbi:DUF2971 domain-containing protein [Shewanella sp. SW24]|uniref:DUF2971 domain-containing protein n=1 Tax=Shewanella TaxID=22 RepID=UPI0021D8BD54|nr:DUF2971 domain-containing protein [Shewanella sp. SW24]MCU7988260.1 DUF2971 domain-containing protein [Shewanella sp. SW24]